MQDTPLTVSQLTKTIKSTIETAPALQQVLLIGEISNFKHHSRGHMYFTLKDQGAKISAVMFQGNNRQLAFMPENGMSVVIQGKVSVYEPFGQYQLYVQDMQPDGIGQLYQAYEQLKTKLEAEGLFDQTLKKPLVEVPDEVAIITSRTGAVIRDICTTAARRFPRTKLTLFPVAVQGDSAPASIVQALKRVNAMQRFDAVIVGRGGGSIEELWGFNDEAVVREIAASHVPVISAVGHETDVTLADFAADVRAPTPTAAAELALPSAPQLAERIEYVQGRLVQLIGHQVQRERERLERLRMSQAFRYPRQLLAQKEQELDHKLERLTRETARTTAQARERNMQLEARLKSRHPAQQVKQGEKDVTALAEKLHKAMERTYETKTAAFEHRATRLDLLNPVKIMRRGFSAVYNENDALVRSTQDLTQNEQLNIYVADGRVQATVNDVDGETLAGGPEKGATNDE
ncbi:exodeoxyribonuclease VII large subunit [Salsuginibacillus halophilus]|uniref:Exodeoxyribonuclease 7 large subunit n=1 Tax=Salsuginibacillus halophilus TaxID=517424 RepID=A0A2P8HAE9_9BACI|nr:exodeoxyribonuclease VII large subunit [Salsuginibacillus halophilus]PSL43198.1 exodeoxyribonuclease VII large subunit [Salsuginibacillus halophilus]